MTIYSPNYLESNEFTLTGAAGRITPANMQDFIDSAFGLSATQQSGTTYTLALTDAGTCVETTSSSAVTITVPPNSSVAFLVGTIIQFLQYGTGQITLAPGSGVTLRTASTLTSRAQYSLLQIRQRATNEWVVSGDLS